MVTALPTQQVPAVVFSSWGRREIKDLIQISFWAKLKLIYCYSFTFLSASSILTNQRAVFREYCALIGQNLKQNKEHAHCSRAMKYIKDKTCSRAMKPVVMKCRAHSFSASPTLPSALCFWSWSMIRVMMLTMNSWLVMLRMLCIIRKPGEHWDFELAGCRCRWALSPMTQFSRPIKDSKRRDFWKQLLLSYTTKVVGSCGNSGSKLCDVSKNLQRRLSAGSFLHLSHFHPGFGVFWQDASLRVTKGWSLFCFVRMIFIMLSSTSLLAP